MANVKFQEIPAAILTVSGSIVGVRDNGDGTYTDIRITGPEVINFLLSQTRKLITAVGSSIGAGGATYTDPFFVNPITEIVTGTQTFIRDVDFTQAGAIITAINFGFYDTQKFLARL